MTRLMIIDDAPEDREFLKELASKNSGFDVHTFGTGDMALDHFHEYGTDCVLLDYRLAGEDGLSVLAAFRARSLYLPIFLMSGQSYSDLGRIAESAGANSLLLKTDLTSQGLNAIVLAAIEESEQKRGLASIDRGQRQVLLVEDNEDDRNYIADMIRGLHKDIRVEAVEDGDSALEFFAANNVDCTILDYRLEAEDGLTVLTKIKDKSPYHPVVMLTGQGNEEVAATSIKAGASDYLIKQRLTPPYLKTAIENAMSRTLLEAKVADQEEERRRFLNVLVHDLRAPLRNVRALGETAAQEGNNGNVDEMETLLKTQSMVTQSATELVDALEVYALLDGNVNFSSVSLTDAAIAAKENLSQVIEERNAVVEIEDLPTIEGHRAQLIQLFQNLIDNALKYNESETPAVKIRTDGKDLVVVQDNGIGVATRHLEAIFAPLKRLWSTETYKGTGLGLATCRKIVERHNGQIWCTSNDRDGSAFVIRIPNSLS